MNLKEQLAGLVEKWRGEAEEHTLLIAKAILRNKANELDAILATLPEPGVVTEEAVGVAWDAGAVASGCAGQEMLPEDAVGMRAALEAALPYLAPAAPAGEVIAWLDADYVVGEDCPSEWYLHPEKRRDGDTPLYAAPQPAPAAQGFDAEVLRSALEEIVRRMPEQAGPAWIAKDIAQAALAAAAKRVGRG